jgi:hypothetical protein
VGEKGTGLKRGEGAWGWTKNVRTWARPRWGCGWDVRDRLMGGVRGIDRESKRAKEKRRRQVGPTEQREGERKRGGAWVGANRRGPPVRDRGRVSARTRG